MTKILLGNLWEKATQVMQASHSLGKCGYACL